MVKTNILKKNRVHCKRFGHTLMELVFAMTAASMLLVGLASTMFLGRQVAYAPNLSERVLEGSNVVSEIRGELRYAIHLVKHSANEIKFVVSDRTGDGVEDVIQYSWDGTPGAPLLKSVNGSDPYEAISSIQEFDLAYGIESTSETVKSFVESDESVLWSSTGGSSKKIDVEDNSAHAQRLTPLIDKPGIPSDIISWSLTEIQFESEDTKSEDGELMVQICKAGIQGNPENVSAFSTNFYGPNGFSRKKISLSSPVQDLSPFDSYALVFKWGDDAGGELVYDDADTGYLKSYNSGADWTLYSDRALRHAVKGRVITPGTPLEVTRRWIKEVEISLQVDANTNSRIASRFQLTNRPEVLSGYHHIDFSSDPTEHDTDGDETVDWISQAGGGFYGDSLFDGVWTVDSVLQSEMTSGRSLPIHIAAVWSSTATGTEGVTMILTAPVSASRYCVFKVGNNLQSDGTQTITLYDYVGSIYTAKEVVSKVTSGMVEVQLYFDPTTQLVRLMVDDVDFGAFQISSHSASLSTAALSLAADASGEFDSVTFSKEEGAVTFPAID